MTDIYANIVLKKHHSLFRLEVRHRRSYFLFHLSTGGEGTLSEGAAAGQLHVDADEVVQLVGQGKRVEELALQGLLETHVVLTHLKERKFPGLVITLQFVQILLDAVHHFPAELSLLSAIVKLLEILMQCPSELIDFFGDVLSELVKAESVQLLDLWAFLFFVVGYVAGEN